MKNGGCALLLFALFWSAITLTFDGFIGSSVVRSLLAQRFATTYGTITSSEVTEHRGSKRTTYGVRISYTYRVNGTAHTGDRFRYDTSSTSDSAWAHQAVRELPMGGEVKVYYDPQDPGDSVLRPGLAGSDLFLGLFMTPFNAVMLALWWVALGQIWRRRRKPIAGGVIIQARMQGTVARMTDFSPLAAGVVGVAALAFFSIFILGIGFGGFHPSLRVATITWIFVLGGGLAAACWQWRRIVTGKYDLVIDELHGTIRLPMNFGRKTEQVIARAEVQAVSIETVLKQGSKGSITTYYAPTLRLIHPNNPTEKLAEWLDAEKAEAFASWLRERLHLNADGTGATAVFPAPIRPGR